MTMVPLLRLVVLLSVLCGCWAQFFDCPMTWEVYQRRCYEFNYYPTYDYTDAVAACHKNGASLVSINSLAEHNFIIQQLQRNDATGHMWYTSGVVDDISTGDLKWDGDGTAIAETDQWWFSEADRLKNGRRIVYKSEGSTYGWTRVVTATILPYICEISQDEAYRINEEDRDFSYGTNITDPQLTPMGPEFIVEPKSVIVVPYTPVPDEHHYASLECVAIGNPRPTYTIYHTDVNGVVTEVTSALSSRYTITGGRLVITNPDETTDAGSYQCAATNSFGTIHSNRANVTFGRLGDFSNVQRETVLALEYQSASIECDPPDYLPAVSYQWYRDRNNDFVRPDLNEYMFISSNGKLYFSEVTANDISNYNCLVKLISDNSEQLTSDQPPSRVSMDIYLDVLYMSPTTWGPEIADGFIMAYPTTLLRGDTIKLECLAYGTMPLIYSWRRLDGPMSDRVVISDHNRVLEIVAAQSDDTGEYECMVRRNSEAHVTTSYNLVLEAKPYFVFPLQNQHADSGSQLTWRCEGKGIPTPTYSWFKNGQKLVPVPGDIDIRQNVMIIQALDAARHNGMYSCSAENRHGITYSTAQLRVLSFAPSFHKFPLSPTQMAALGGETTIVCSPEAAPRPAYTWTRNGAALNLPEDDGTSRVRKLANGNLYISDVQYADAGQYGCTATNIHGSDTSFGVLEVVTRTVITQAPFSTLTQVNQTAMLMCIASFPAHVDQIYRWRFSGRPIDLERHPHYSVSNTQNTGSLYVTKARHTHEGWYECVAQTTHDQVTAQAYLTVQGPPGECSGVRVSETTATAARLHWVTGQEYGRPIEYHTVEAHTEHNHTWVPVALNIPYTASQVQGTNSHSHTWFVENLKPGNGYYFRVRASNGLGIGQASMTTVAYRTLSAPPTMYPDNVGGGGGSVGTLKLTWTPLSPEDQGASGIGYVVRWREEGFTTYEEETVGNVGTFSTTVGADKFYLIYEVAVKAFNDLGEGPWSPAGVFIYSAESIPIGVATNVYAWPHNATAIQVSWDMISDDRMTMRGTLLGYQVNYWERDDPDPIINAISWRGQSSSGVVIGLDPYKWYTVDVQVLNTAGMGPRSELTYSRTYWHAPLLYPTEVHVYSHSSQSARVTWRGVSTGISEESLSGYIVRTWQTTDDIQTAEDVVADRGATEAIVYGIQKDTVYQVRVLAFSRGGEGKHSKSSYFTLGGQIPFDPSSSEVLFASSDRPVPRLVLFITIFLTHSFVLWRL